jgi:hypothetical protein
VYVALGVNFEGKKEGVRAVDSGKRGGEVLGVGAERDP